MRGYAVVNNQLLPQPQYMDHSYNSQRADMQMHVNHTFSDHIMKTHKDWPVSTTHV